MATQKKKSSKHRTRLRHAANLKVTPVSGLVGCTNCGQRTRPHQACVHCGYYRGQRLTA